MILPGDPFAKTWMNTKSEITHKREFRFNDILNSQIGRDNMRSRRVEDDIYSLYDLEVLEFDYSILKYGNLLCRIDLETKPDRFPERGVPKRWVRGVSFLKRKTTKTINYDRDLYILMDSSIDTQNKYPRVIWAPYRIIRDFGEEEHYGFKNDFLTIRENHYHHLNFTISSITKWCSKLKNNEVEEGRI